LPAEQKRCECFALCVLLLLLLPQPSQIKHRPAAALPPCFGMSYYSFYRNLHRSRFRSNAALPPPFRLVLACFGHFGLFGSVSRTVLAPQPF
jgi:hypothetical protein